jgi:hypothetical protein
MDGDVTRRRDGSNAIFLLREARGTGRGLKLPPGAMVWGELCESETPQVGVGGLAEFGPPNLPSIRVASGGAVSRCALRPRRIPALLRHGKGLGVRESSFLIG